MDLLVTAKIFGTFGVEGFVKISSFSGEYEHLLNLAEIRLRLPKSKTGKETQELLYTIEEIELRYTDALLKLEGIDSVEAAKKLVGSELLVPRDMACPLYEGEFYITDLCNSILVYQETPVGTITSVAEGGGGYVLEISEAETGLVKYVPFIKQFIGKVDIAQKRVELMHRWILE
ncbi:16S rRNA processing protein RimM [Treponema phagedenis]|uniref:Ribosome maturation factor RimM n=1 Tax=Treponema phagedenis TaxID=162 RepID=A0A0B7GVM9_TREPH|nr:ribosome maturation factor RimM [Treponema phagedenis]EFW38107.1 16S rRNA processing protein RimM [Treponema phagedenis F0421]NVP23444.1 16S rRNA processing protein RimM [Treponema phagedenis]QEJ95660.1 16S rRNA processing protein RimM [Treponema phagedenis]QEJ98585.1 16S rRNA processing protein RimM [Treponema phagedenis]QEK01518.1 16S rRNA processing protein RimM [Treponema phagedenis]